MPRARQTPPDLDDTPREPITTPAGPVLRKGDQADPAAARPAVPAAAVVAPGSVSGRAATRPNPTSSDVNRTASKIRVGYYQQPDHLARARSAFHWSRLQEGHRSLSDFIDHAIMREVERVEGLYNDGQPWPPLDAGELPTGRPVGS